MTVEETWELAKKLCFIDKENGFTGKEFHKIFGGGVRKEEVFAMTPYEVKEKVDEYKNKINIGDIIYSDLFGKKYVVLDINEEDGVILLFGKNKCSWHRWFGVLPSHFIKVDSTNLIEDLRNLLR